MLNFPPSSISFYIILTLSILLAVVSTISVKLYRGKVEAESALVVAIDANTEMVKAANLQKMSCDVNDTSVVELVAEISKIDEAVNPINSQLKDLATVKKTHNTNKVNTKETIKDESNFLPDDGLLSPNVTGLLNKGWCAAYPEDSQCLPTRQPVSDPL